ncbi:HAD hydrolase-like protein [Succinivibrio dextrinosolvens]|uniref:HAD hydrolase-like protein n=1 Tax=Succinivibrio dextrinosolvens TaxID=83771 RepID=UPI00192117DC|nr:HAD hydrolase-like protein [Succinivibrio dextrinosolvens]
MIKNVIFDLDGTLLDTREGIIESVRYTAQTLGYDELSYEKLLTFVGPPIQNSFITHYGCDVDTAQKAADIFRDYYKNKALFLAVPYDGIYELCENLQSCGIKMSVATYKREDYALTLLRHFYFDKYCTSMHGADNRNHLKKEDIIRICMSEMNATNEDCVLVGDTDNDAMGANNANTPFIAVTYGFGFKSKGDVEKYPYIGIACTPQEVFKIISGRS